MEGSSESKRLNNDQSKDCWAERGKARSKTAPKVVRGVLSVFLKNCYDAGCLNSRLQHSVKSSVRNDEEKDKTKGSSTRIGHTDQLLVTTDDGRRNDNVHRGGGCTVIFVFFFLLLPDSA